MHGVVGHYGLESTTSENGERLVSFTCANGLCLTNTFFAHKQWREQPSMEQQHIYVMSTSSKPIYDSVDRNALIVILKSYRVSCHLIDIIKEMYTETWSPVKTAEGSSEEFRVESGVRQGCVLSPLLFNCLMDKILRETLEATPGGWSEYTTTEGLFLTYREKTLTTTDIQNVQYADDLTLVAKS